MKRNKILALFLAFLLMFTGLVSVAAFAEELPTEENTSGTAAPYMFKTEYVGKNSVKAWLELSPAVAQSVTAFQFAVQLETKDGTAVPGREMTLDFDAALAGAKVKKAIFDKDTQIMKIYVASTENLVIATSEEADSFVVLENILPIGTFGVEELDDIALNPFKITVAGMTGGLVTLGADFSDVNVREAYGADFVIPADGTIYELPAQLDINVNVTGEGTATVYTVKDGADTAVNGTADKGSVIKIAATPAEGYLLKSVKAVGADGNEITLSKNNTFTILSDVNVNVVFEKIAEPETEPSTDPEPEEPTTQPTPAGNNCSCLCHKTGFLGFIYKIVHFFWKLFKINPVCACDNHPHY